MPATACIAMVATNLDRFASGRHRFGRRAWLAAAVLVLAGCATTTDVASSRAWDEEQMLRLLSRSAQSWNSGDLSGHLAIYDPSVTVMTKNGPREGIQPIRSSFERTYFVDGKPKQTLSMERVDIRFLTKDSALMTGRFVLSGGQLPEQSGWFSLVWVRELTGWRVVHDHTR